MGKKSPPPAPPNLQPLTDAQLKIADQADALAREYLGMSREQFSWFKENAAEELNLAREQASKFFALQDRALASDEEAKKIFGEVSQTQIDAMRQQMDFAQRDRKRWEETYVPLQDRAINEAQEFDTPERREAEAARAAVDVQRNAEAQRASADARLAGMGIDPSQFRAGSIANQMAVATAAQSAAASNNARTMIEDKGRALRADAINMGMGLPSQVAASYAGATNSAGAASGAAGAGQGATLAGIQGAIGAGQAGMGARGGALGQYAALTGSPMQWSQMGTNAMGMSSNGIMNAGSLMNQNFGNQMTRFNAQQQQSQSTMNMIGGIAGAAMGAFIAEGGHVGKVAAQQGIVRQRPSVEVMDIEIDPRAGAKRALTQTEHGMALQRAERLDAMRDRMAGAQQGMDTFNAAAASGPEWDTEVKQMIRPHYYADGGPVPGVQSRDIIPAQLSPDEYVIPADVVKAKGIEFFDRLLQKYHRQGS